MGTLTEDARFMLLLNGLYLHSESSPLRKTPHSLEEAQSGPHVLTTCFLLQGPSAIWIK